MKIEIYGMFEYPDLDIFLPIPDPGAKKASDLGSATL
jgi:hypothetical protein